MSPGLTPQLPRFPERNGGQTCQAGPLRTSAVATLCPREQQCPFQLAYVVQMKAAWMSDRFLNIPQGEGYMERTPTGRQEEPSPSEPMFSSCP